MFFAGCCNTLKFCLDPSMHKRYQRNIKVGSLHPDYFNQYFSQQGGSSCNRVKYLSYFGNHITVNCLAYEFNSFDSLPGLFNDRHYAHISWKSCLKTLIQHNSFPLAYCIADLIYEFRVYFTRIVFICNPITHMVSVDFEMVKERKLDGTNNWIII